MQNNYIHECLSSDLYMHACMTIFICHTNLKLLAQNMVYYIHYAKCKFMCMTYIPSFLLRSKFAMSTTDVERTAMGGIPGADGNFLLSASRKVESTQRNSTQRLALSGSIRVAQLYLHNPLFVYNHKKHDRN